MCLGLRPPLQACPPLPVSLLPSCLLRRHLLRGALPDRAVSLFCSEPRTGRHPTRVIGSLCLFLAPRSQDCCLPHLPVPRDSVDEWFFCLDEGTHWCSERFGDLPHITQLAGGSVRPGTESAGWPRPLHPLLAVCWDPAMTLGQRPLGPFKGVTSLRSPSSLVLRDGAGSRSSEEEALSCSPGACRKPRLDPHGRGGTRKSQAGFLVLPADSPCHCPPSPWATESCVTECYLGCVGVSVHQTRAGIFNPLR